MATLVLGAVGTSVAGPVGGFIGASVGAAIDNLVLIPSILGEQQQEFTGQRLDRARFQSAQEGAPMAYVLGPENRVSGMLIYLAEIEEEITETETGGGGKGGGSRQKSKQTTYNYYQTLAFSLCEAVPNGTVERIWADSELIYDRNGQVDARYDSIAIYNGHERQYPTVAAQNTADPDIVAAKAFDGVATPTPPYRGVAYVVISRLHLKDWGNRIPSFSALVREKAEKPVQEALQSLWSRSDLSTDDLDVSQVPGCLRGYTLVGAVPSADPMRILMQAFNLSVQDLGTEMRVFSKTSPDVVTIDNDHLAARQHPSDRSSRPASFTRTSLISMPSEMTIKYVEPWQSYQPGLQRERRQGAINTAKASVELPIVLDSYTARSIAKRMLWTAYQERLKVVFTLPPTYMHILEGDVVPITVEGEVYDVRITNVSRGADWVLEFEGIVQDTETFSQIAIADRPVDRVQAVYTPPSMMWRVLNLPPLAPGDESDCVYYVAAKRVSREVGYGGAVVYRSGSPNGVFASRGALLAESRFFPVGAVMADVPASHGTWDLSTELVVTSDTPLLSASEDDIFALGANTALIGEEIVQFRDVESLGDNQYRITSFLRGLRGTESKSSSHSSMDYFVLLDRTIFSDTVLAGESGASKSFKVIAAGGLINDTDSTSAALTCETLRPFSPSHISAPGGTGTRAVSWHPRSRSLPTDWLTASNLPVDDDRYKVEIYDSGGPDWTTLSIVAMSPFNLTSTHRTTAGYSSSERVLIRISQYSAVYGDFGTPQEAMV